MKRVVLAVLMFGFASCTVEGAPITSAPATDDSVEVVASEAATSSTERDAEPNTCNVGCSTPAQCRASGGISGGPCNIPGLFCCR